jgi:hypothetical protein
MVSGQVFSEYFGFPCQKPFILHHHNHPGQLAEALQRAVTLSRSPADCPRSSNRNETESFIEAAKAQNWVVEPQEKKKIMKYLTILFYEC